MLSSLSLPRSPFHTFQGNFRCRTSFDNFGMLSLTLIRRSTFNLFRRTYQAFSRPSRLNVFIKLFKLFYINMTSKSVFRMYHIGRLLDFVIANSHFEINGYLFRQARGVAMGSPAAPPLCNLVATVEDFCFWHQTVTSSQCRLPDFGVIWHERYVDNRFILLRSSADPSAALDNFLSLEASGHVGDTT